MSGPSSDYLARTARSIASGPGWSEHWKQLGREYLLEEMALVACLVADGWPMMVYPGSIDSFVEIAEAATPRFRHRCRRSSSSRST